MDERAKELAKIVVDYSTSVKPGDFVVIKGEIGVCDFIAEIARNVVDRKARPVLQIRDPDVKRYFLLNGDIGLLDKTPSYLLEQAREADVVISVSYAENPKYLEGVDTDRLAKDNKAYRPISDIVVGDGKQNPGKRWCVVGYPSVGSAATAGMSFEKYSDVIFSATNIDWVKFSQKMEKVKDAFDDASLVRIYVPGKTDLSFSLSGRGGAVSDGRRNMPSGEVFYGPVEDSMEGEITFTYPAIRDGNEVSGIWLKYSNGEIIEFKADKNQEFLESMLALDGAKRVGEFGIGCNYGIKEYMKNLLFDEKIGGTIHLALGRSYKRALSDGGGLNDSDIHWDIVCDLRDGGEMYVDGKLVQKDGKWMI